MNLPVDPKSILDAVKTVEEARNIPVSACVIIDPSVSAELAGTVRLLFEPQSPGASVTVNMLGDEALGYDRTTDFACIVAGESGQIGKLAQQIRGDGVPVIVVAEDVEAVKAAAVKSGRPIPEGDLLNGSEPDALPMALGKWVLSVEKKKKLALAQAFSFARRPLATESINATSLQNAGVGAVLLIPGADMPVMTMNQIKMLLQIAAAYGQPMDMGRVKELAGVLAGGFAARTVARQLVGLVPVGGWAIKGGIGYTATSAMGYAALNYFEGGGGLAGVGNIANAAAEKAVAAASSVKGATKKVKATAGQLEGKTASKVEVAKDALKSAGTTLAGKAKSTAAKAKKGVVTVASNAQAVAGTVKQAAEVISVATGKSIPGIKPKAAKPKDDTVPVIIEVVEDED